MFEEWLMQTIIVWFDADMDKDELLKYENPLPVDLYKHFKKRYNKIKPRESPQEPSSSFCQNT